MGNVMMAADEPLAGDVHSMVRTRSQNFITPTRDVMIIEQMVRVRVRVRGLGFRDYGLRFRD